MFRRFFQRNGQGQTPGPQESGQPSSPDLAELLKQQIAQQKDDGVHRTVLRVGEQKPPDDPDEQAYASDQEEHAETARNALQSGDFNRSVYHLGLALASDPAREDGLAPPHPWSA